MGIHLDQSEMEGLQDDEMERLRDGAATLQARTRHREVTDEGDCGDGSGCGKGRDAPPLSPLYSFCNKGVLFVQKIAANGNCRTTQLSQKRAQSTPQRSTEFNKLKNFGVESKRLPRGLPGRPPGPEPGALSG